MTDPFKNRAPNLNGPATDIVPVTPSDVTDFPRVAVALYIETGGSLSFVSQVGATRTIEVAGQSILPVGTRRVMATGTTAAGIHAFMVG